MHCHAIKKKKIENHALDKLDYQSLFGKGATLLPRTHGWTHEDSFVSLSQSDIRQQIFVGHKLSHQFGLGEDVELTNSMRKNFRDNLDQKFKNSPQEKLEKLVNGQDMFLFSRQGRENLNILVPEPQITTSR